DAFRRAANELVALGAAIDTDGAIVFDPTLAAEEAGSSVESVAEVAGPGVQRAELAEGVETLASAFLPPADQAVSAFEPLEMDISDPSLPGGPARAGGGALGPAAGALEPMTEEIQPSAFRPAEPFAGEAAPSLSPALESLPPTMGS